ncbi:MAG: DUF4157 domain-containing protein [Pseudomonadales bacterium]
MYKQLYKPETGKRSQEQAQSVVQKKKNNTGLPDRLKTGMESFSGMDLSDVRVHRNSPKPAQIGAHAYTEGTEIHMGPGQAKHLPHELGHVIQQLQGEVPPTTEVAGQAINDDPGLEQQATVWGNMAKERDQPLSH